MYVLNATTFIECHNKNTSLLQRCGAILKKYIFVSGTSKYTLQVFNCLIDCDY